MANKNSFIRVRGKDLTVDQFERELQNEIKADIEEAQNNAIYQIVTALQDFIDDLNNKSSNRGRGFLGSVPHYHNGLILNYNQPMQDAQVEVSVGADKNGFPTYKIEVDDYVFNLLDRGRDERRTKTAETFVTYTGHKTLPDSVEINTANVATGAIHTVPPGEVIQGFKPRRFYVNAIKKYRFKKLTKIQRKELYFNAPLISTQDRLFEFDPNIEVRVIKRYSKQTT